MPGFPQQTKLQAKIKGVDRDDRYSPDLEAGGLKFQKQIPETPEHLKEAGSRVWLTLFSQIVKVDGWVSVVDVPLIEHYCGLIDVLDKLKKVKPTVKRGDSTFMNPEFKTYLVCLKEVRDIGNLYGLNPVARNKVRFMKTEEFDSFSELKL